MELEPIIQRFDADTIRMEQGFQKAARLQSEYGRIAKQQAEKLAQMEKEIADRQYAAAVQHNRRMNLAKGLSRFNEWTTLVQPLSPEYAAAARALGRHHPAYDNIAYPKAKPLPTAIQYLDDMGAVPVLRPVSAQRARQIERGEAARRRLERLGASWDMYGDGNVRQAGGRFAPSGFGPGYQTSNIIGGGGGGYGTRLDPYSMIGSRGAPMGRFFGRLSVGGLSKYAPGLAGGLLGGLIGAAGGPLRGAIGGIMSGSMIGGPAGGVAGGALGFGVGMLSSGLSMSIGLFEKAISGATRLGEAVFKIGMEYEKVLIYFQVFTKSQAEAASLVGSLRDLAVSSPFRFDQLSQTASTLLGYGITPGNVVPTTARLSMMAGGSEERLHRLSLAYAQVLSAGKFHGQELRQFAEAGVGAPDFAQTMGVNTSEFRSRMRQGMIGPDVVTATINRLTGPGGRFASINDALLNSVSGRSNALMETLQFKGADVGLQVFQRFDVAGKIKDATVWLDKFLSRMNELEPAFKFVEDTATSFWNNLKTGFQTAQELWEGSALQSMWQFFMPSTWEESAQSVDNWGKTFVVSLGGVIDVADKALGVLGGLLFFQRKISRVNLWAAEMAGIKLPGTDAFRKFDDQMDNAGLRLLDEVGRPQGGGGLNINPFGMPNMNKALADVEAAMGQEWDAKRAANAAKRNKAVAMFLGMPAIGGLGGMMAQWQDAQRVAAGVNPWGVGGAVGALGGNALDFLGRARPNGAPLLGAMADIWRQGKFVGNQIPEIPIELRLDAEIIKLAQGIKDGFRDGVGELQKFWRDQAQITEAQFGKYASAQPLIGGPLAAMFRGMAELNDAEALAGRYQVFLKLKGKFGGGEDFQLPTLAMAGSAEAAQTIAQSGMEQKDTLMSIEEIMKQALAEEVRQREEMEALNKWLKENPIVVKPRALQGN